MPTSLGQALVLTDDTELRSKLSRALAEHEIETIVPNGDGGSLELPDAVPGLAFLDLDLRSPEPLKLIREHFAPERGVALVLLVGEHSIPLLASAMESGGTSYLKKPLARGEVSIALGQIRRLQLSQPESDGLYGSSPQIQAIRKLVLQVAGSSSHVTVAGEAGVGKRVVGRLIHEKGPRRGEPFLQLTCGGINEDVVRELLFGTGAPGTSGEGYLSRCRRGTLLIDDVDLLGPSIQEALFRYLTEGKMRAAKPGRHEGTPRVIAASCRALSAEVRAGAFHRGLFDLLDRVRIELPPLRERKADIPILADYFSRSVARASHKPCRGIEPAALAELMRYDWPGNVRELQDILEHAVRSASGATLRAEDLPALPETAGTTSPGSMIPGSTIYEIEKDAILRTLEAAGGSTSRAARILEMSVRKIQYKLKEYRTEASSIATIERLSALAGPKTPHGKKDTLVAGKGSRG